MTKLNPYSAGFIAAGIFAAMMVVFSAMGILVLVPVFFGSLPIYVAALGWGTRAGVIATALIVIFAALASDPTSGLLIAMTIAAPAALAGHQANLAQSVHGGSADDGNQMVWYPLSNILLWIALLIAGAVLVFGLLVNFDPNVIGPQLAKQLQELFPSSQNGIQLSEEKMSEALILNLEILPFVLPSLWVGIHVCNLLLGMRITRKMGVLARPAEDVAAGFVLPQYAILVLIIVMGGMVFTSPPLSYGLAVVSGALVMAFSIVGLASLHHNIRDWNTRTPILVLLYLIIALIFFPVYLFSFSGIMKSARKMRDENNPNI